MQGKTKPSPTVSSAALASPGQRRRSQPGEVTRRVASPERSLAVVKSQKGLPVARSGEWFASRRAERRRWRGLYGPDDGRTSKGVTGENDANPFRAQSRPVPAPVPVPSSYLAAPRALAPMVHGIWAMGSLAAGAGAGAAATTRRRRRHEPMAPGLPLTPNASGSHCMPATPANFKLTCRLCCPVEGAKPKKKKRENPNPPTGNPPHPQSAAVVRHEAAPNPSSIHGRHGGQAALCLQSPPVSAHAHAIPAQTKPCGHACRAAMPSPFGWLPARAAHAAPQMPCPAQAIPSRSSHPRPSHVPSLPCDPRLAPSLRLPSTHPSIPAPPRSDLFSAVHVHIHVDDAGGCIQGPRAPALAWLDPVPVPLPPPPPPSPRPLPLPLAVALQEGQQGDERLAWARTHAHPLFPHASSPSTSPTSCAALRQQHLPATGAYSLHSSCR
ncbi:hypothetical protein PCL_00186 [Purpureocillium lilacinum]|uniref:Uncharacterized protein n=1 Tax=Purpureocillium lilacinum TaxID=33203 RepID=A0A2U3E6A3_PURLI|nr:hypothetical protein PCL_00186 [Purpureocillium lilacinum]